MQNVNICVFKADPSSLLSFIFQNRLFEEFYEISK